MQVFGPVIYMDVPKTGSTFVTEFLKNQVRYAHEVTRKHSRLMRPRRREEVILLTSRDPIGSWLSLYNYGCTGVGRVRRRLDRRGVGERFYTGDPEDFDAWIEHLTSPDAMEDLGEDYASLAHLGVQLLETYRAKNVIDVRIRYSQLNDDLIAACIGPLSRHLRVDADPSGFLAATERINASDRRVTSADILERTRERIREAEALWYAIDEG